MAKPHGRIHGRHAEIAASRPAAPSVSATSRRFGGSCSSLGEYGGESVLPETIGEDADELAGDARRTKQSWVFRNLCDAGAQLGCRTRIRRRSSFARRKFEPIDLALNQAATPKVRWRRRAQLTGLPASWPQSGASPALGNCWPVAAIGRSRLHRDGDQPEKVSSQMGRDFNRGLEPAEH
jgi:hypothetical protein